MERFVACMPQAQMMHVARANKFGERTLGAANQSRTARHVEATLIGVQAHLHNLQSQHHLRQSLTAMDSAVFTPRIHRTFAVAAVVVQRSRDGAVFLLTDARRVEVSTLGVAAMQMTTLL